MPVPRVLRSTEASTMQAAGSPALVVTPICYDGADDVCQADQIHKGNSVTLSEIQMQFVFIMRRCVPEFRISVYDQVWLSLGTMAAKQQPPLIKKHSQSDLVSRLKTRKILGVGGKDDDGEIHRSKISQVLGNEMKFAMREPLGLRIWQLMSAIMFSLVAIIALTFPKLLYEAVFEEEGSNSKMSVRLYGGALLSISVIMWHALYTAEKSVIQWTLLTEAFYFTVQFLVTIVPLFEKGALPQGAILLQLSRGFFLLISVYFYYQVGRKPKKV
ncbi:tumor protein p53-inducible protein 11-like isoform X2 [Carcharodon carcharias]|uniref:tumor protein p53-inducible protein 11-like isoform X2 n=2 Tax=Carcharodon carcharias TaxID=13397 RepID=UPI001B7E8357|nr:tumor protein p53-inducible protein 11-like isoform X2 [Carcharodon carcharias]